jgi:hypothetical protein
VGDRWRRALVVATVIGSTGVFATAAPSASADGVRGVSSANLISNGSAELPAYRAATAPARWSHTHANPLTTFVWASGTAHGGRRSLEVVSETPAADAWTQTVTLDPTRLYRLSGWIKTVNAGQPGTVDDPGANLAVRTGPSRTSALLGTHDWTFVSTLFRTDADGQATISAGVGGVQATAGIAWFDGIQIARVVATPTSHPRWRLLVNVYDRTDVALSVVDAPEHRGVGVLTANEKTAIDAAARRFATVDIPALTSGNMIARVTVRHLPLVRLEPIGNNKYWPSPARTAADRDPAFDSVITVWKSDVVDTTTGASQWIGTAAGLTPSDLGVGQTYTSMISDAAFSYGNLNVWKHEYGHSLLFYFAAAGTTSRPAVDSHATATTYVHCGSGTPYVWVDESDANPIPNSIYNNRSGFTHDYYSGTTALSGNPSHRLGILPTAWAQGGPVTMTTRTLAPQARMLLATVGDLVAARALAPSRAAVLAVEISRAARALEAVHASAASCWLRAFLGTVGTDLARHRITPADARVLRDDAQVILQQLG